MGTRRTSVLRLFKTLKLRPIKQYVWTRLFHDEEGQDLIEYALLMAFIALAAVVVLSSLKTNVTKLWNSVSNALSNAVTASS